jgi:hypothetical protein
LGDFAEKSVGKAAISWHNSVIEALLIAVRRRPF